MKTHTVIETTDEQGEPVIVIISNGVTRVYTGRLAFGQQKVQSAGTQKRLV